MNPQEIYAKIMAVVKELDKMEVKGKENCKILTICSDYLEALAKDIKEAAEAPEPINEE